MAEMAEEQLHHQQLQQIKPGEVPAGYFRHTECAKGTCKPESQTVQCPLSAICKHCGIPENNDQICPKVSLLHSSQSIFMISDFLFVRERTDKQTLRTILSVACARVMIRTDPYVISNYI